ncbi:putative formin binding [Phaeomoniella chlamydospora]|uniref:Putative formin binding n=1 Tax=Phaeomoniella chlamydospora TaxID=158046 RepID=A0A0G2EWJ8_PHACM|nr:putative formin binding [Phaeomoniella chlamydospora]
MAEYWKSTPKYWCKHCGLYVKDTKFERQQHEATGKHQGNLKRFLRGVHQERDKEEREKQRAKAEVDRLKGLVGSTVSSAAHSPVPQPSKPRASNPAPQATIADRKKQMAQLAEMGIAVPDDFRADLALAGDWQTVAQRSLDTDGQKNTEALNVGIRKRKAENDDDADVIEDQPLKHKGWGSSLKTYPGASSSETPDLEDLLSGRRAPKKELETDEPSEDIEAKREPGESPDLEQIEDKMAVKEQIDTFDAAQANSRLGIDVPPTGIMFKKRKLKPRKQS